MSNNKGAILGLAALGLSLYALLRRPPGGSQTRSGTYIGDGLGPRQIKTGFRCSEVTILNNISSAIYILVPEKTNCQRGGVTADITSYVYLADADGFIVDNGPGGANLPGIPYYWWAST